MKKQLLVIALITGLLVGLGTTAAQAVDHELEIVIPAVLMIRFVNSAGVGFDQGATAVVFEPSPEQVADGATVYRTESVPMNWVDIQVFANTRETTWGVGVDTDNDEFDWGQVTVTPSGAFAIAAFPLPVNNADAPQPLFTTTEATRAEADGPVTWVSLGISPDSYSLTFDGTEEEGDYSTTVTYTIAGP